MVCLALTAKITVPMDVLAHVINLMEHAHVNPDLQETNATQVRNLNQNMTTKGANKY